MINLTEKHEYYFMDYLLQLMIKTHIVLLIISFFLYIAEITTGYINFFRPFFRKKRKENEVRGTAIVFSFSYFMFMLLFLLYDVLVSKTTPENFSFGVWLSTSCFLTLIFWNIYFHYHMKKLKENNN